MNCENLQSDLSLYLDNVLSEDRRVSIQKHLPTCPLCRQKLDEYKFLKNSLRSISRPAIPAELLTNVRQAVAHKITQPTIQIGTEERFSFTEKIFHWLLPYSIGTVAASILTFVMLTAILSTSEATTELADQVQNKDEQSSILLAQSTPRVRSSEQPQLANEFDSALLASYQPEINPSGALMALSNSIVRGNMKDEEVVIVADVFNNGLAKITSIVEAPSNDESMDILQKAFEVDPERAPFLPNGDGKSNNSVRVILKIQRVDVSDSK